jgi:hypothetical protein
LVDNRLKYHLRVPADAGTYTTLAADRLTTLPIDAEFCTPRPDRMPLRLNPLGILTVNMRKPVVSTAAWKVLVFADAVT